MAFIKRKSNARHFVEREHLLDVKLRANQVRAARTRMLGMFLTVSFIVLVVGFLSWRGGKFLMDYFFYKNDAFAIRQIEVQTDGVLSSDSICKWAGLKPGLNLLAVDLMRVKRDLEAQSSVHFVAVERVFPHTLKLRVSEREPIVQTTIMQARSDGTYEPVVYYLDQEGFPMKPLDPKLLAQQPPVPYERLPILLGVETGDIQPGKKVDSPQVRAALQLLDQFERSSMIGLVELQRINVAYPEVLVVTTSQGADITFSLSQFDVQFRRWYQIYDYFQKAGKAIASIDLSISNYLPVHLVAASTVQPLPPKTAKPKRTKRKNV